MKKEEIEGENGEITNSNKQEKLSEKELKAKKHLEETFEITKNISYADIEFKSRNNRDIEREEVKDELR